MCSDARIDTSGATDLSIRATRSSTFCHGAVPQDAADEGFIIGSGPIIIGHAAEFDYAGSQASRSFGLAVPTRGLTRNIEHSAGSS